MVNETTSDAISAMAKVKPNGLNSSPIRPPTKVIGKNTATVVIVAAVMAVATSRTARRMAFFFGSP